MSLMRRSCHESVERVGLPERSERHMALQKCRAAQVERRASGTKTDVDAASHARYASVFALHTPRLRR